LVHHEGNEGVEQAEVATAGVAVALDEVKSGACSAEMFHAETEVSGDTYAESPLTRSDDTDKVAGPPEASAVIPYGDDCKLIRPRLHKRKEKLRHSHVARLHPHDPSVRLQVDRLIRELRKEEQACPACRKERDFAVEEERCGPNERRSSGSSRPGRRSSDCEQRMEQPKTRRRRNRKVRKTARKTARKRARNRHSTRL
jgi:hypothetical protein